MFKPEDYTVGWISAVKVEYVAARALLDEEHPGPAHVSQCDDNAYTLGRIGQHMVVLATAPDGEYGTTQATAVAMRMVASFPNIRVGLMVGIGGGAPSSKHDIRLGDVVVSAPRDGNGGVFQYDFGKTVQGQTFHTTRFLNQPPTLLWTAVRHLDAVYESDGHQLNEAIQSALKKKPKLRKGYTRPVSTSDQLYRSNFVHPADCQITCPGNCDSDSSRLIRRAPRDDDEDDPAIHYGLIASGNQLMKDALVRDRLIQEKDVLCFEMEAAGLMNDFPCLVVRGICDYSDSHKSKNWQGYAAMVASAYAKDLLLKIAPTRLEAEKKLGEVMGKLAQGIESVRQDTEKTVRHLDTEKCREVLNWIASTDHTATHAKHLSKCQEGTGTWLINSEAFQQWLETPGQTLFCMGMPGAGKTIMTSIVVDHLQERFRESRDVGLAYIYCDFRLQSEQSVEHMLAVVLRQLVQRYSVRFGIPPVVDDIYHRHRATGNSLSRTTLCKALRSLSVYFTRIYIMVDALDECQTTGGCRAMFLEKLFDFQDITNANLITTSRPIPEIIQILGVRKNAVRLEIQANKDDLQCYLDGQLGRLPDFVRDDPVLQRKVKSRIVDAVGGMFLLATFHLESLIEEHTVGDLEIALERLPRDFFQTYDQEIERIRRQSDSAQQLTKKVLGWVVFAKRPPKCEALQQAVIVKLEKSNSDERFKPSAEKMVSVCAGLVEMHFKTRKFSLVHYTVYEYLKSQAACNGWFQGMHVHVTHACISYLQEFAETRVKPQDMINFQDSLISYVSRYWYNHASANEHLCRDAIRNLVSDNDGKLRLDCIYAGYDSTSIIPRYVKGWTPLHFTVWHNLLEITTLLLSAANAACINIQDACGETPLSLAVRRGSEKVVKLLLQNGATIDATNGETLILKAASRLNLGILELLISNGASVRTRLGANLWYHATRRNTEYLYELALRFGVDINTKDEEGNTPLLKSVTTEWGSS
ncbi:hypothetical protein NW762_007551 [Fusarium torreyae]|uniref:Nucleoside phosphorylase domain-containing protein n=1 Tax=Fusarium torreyae TaxID=1237075 RepID=A0A9W8S0S0_9HYPO|nr:hypothetical protein NW762_007551 [Fusarium torreyae]